MRNNVHLVIPYSRPQNLDRMYQAYADKGIIVHLLTMEGENTPVKIREPFYHHVYPAMADVLVPNYLIDQFCRYASIDDDDYYCTSCDDDSYEDGVFDAISRCDEDVVVVSMKRGHNIPVDAIPRQQYGNDTLIACLGNMRIGGVGGEQMFVKGRIFKTLRFDLNSYQCDGIMAEHLRDRYQIRYEPELYCLFNYYEPGRWDREITHAFGCLCNDYQRLDMVLKQSDLSGKVHIIYDPKTAVEGLNRLLDTIEAEGADIAILTHQDVYYRAGWLEQMKGQIEKLPDSWIVAGPVGKDMDGKICGRVHDMRIPLHFSTPHTFPHPASCFDELCIIVNMKSGFRFDKGLDGFDLYGTMAVCQVWEMGGTAWVIDAFCEHYCMRPFSWVPGKEFERGLNWLRERYQYAPRIDSTVIGIDERECKGGLKAA